MDAGSRDKNNLQTIRLGHMLGISIGIHYSWFVILVLLTWALAVGYYPEELPGWSAVVYWITSVLTVMLLFVTVLLHEIGHAVVARHYGIPVRGITLFVFGGVAQIGQDPPGAIAEFWIAIAGPLVSFAVAGLLGLLQVALSGVAPLLAMTRYLATMNVLLALFNLIPGFPLDGGRIFRAIVWAITNDFLRASLVAAHLGRGVSLLFIGLGAWQIAVADMATGLWMIFVGWFLETAARAEVQRQETQELLAGHQASEAMQPDRATIPPGITLQQLVDRFILVTGQRSFVIEGKDHAVGLLTLHQIKGVPRSEWATTPAARIMTPAAQTGSVTPDSDLWAVLQQMDQVRATQFPVMANGRVLGMLTRDDITRFLVRQWHIMQDLLHDD